MNRFRCRLPSGKTATLQLAASATVGDLLAQIAQQIPSFDSRANEIRLKHGYPPVELIASPGKILVDCPGVRSGDVFSVDIGPAASRPSSNIMTRLSIPSDNSCLFHAIRRGVEGMGMEGDSVAAMREILASTIEMRPDDFPAAILDGREPSAYCQWIRLGDSWGGEIELSILAEHYSLQLVVVDVRTQQMHRYSPQSPTCAFLIYDGIHYDVLQGDGGQVIFAADDHIAEMKAKEFSACAKSDHSYTDVAAFDLRCEVCSCGLRGAKDATAHAKSTGHTSFVEYAQ